MNGSGGIATAGFQSAPLLRGATQVVELTAEDRDVSIRAPLARGDHDPRLRGGIGRVSIRAPLARGDRASVPLQDYNSGFNPRPSCEGRPAILSPHLVVRKFQSAPLLRGAT